MNQVTQILNQIERSESGAAEKLLPLVYDELRRLAAQRLSQEPGGQTLQATALVHEAYVRLVDVERVQRWNSRGHFFAAAAEAMRRILVENARHKQRLKHGGGRQRVELDGLRQSLHTSGAANASTIDLLALDDALTKFGAEDPIKAELVKLRFFAGMTIPEAAQVLGISHATAERYWTYARTWLHCEMKDSEGPQQGFEDGGRIARSIEGTNEV